MIKFDLFYILVKLMLDGCVVGTGQERYDRRVPKSDNLVHHAHSSGSQIVPTIKSSLWKTHQGFLVCFLVTLIVEKIV